MDWRSCPAAVPLVQQLLAHHEDLASEAIDNLDCFSPSPERYIMDPDDVRLYILPAIWQRQRVDRAALEDGDYRAWRPVASPGRLATATAVLAHLVDHPLVVNAMYSLSFPGCEITPHIDREEAIGEVLRLHVGLRCPVGDCALVVDGERREWRDGEAFIFDSARVTHSAHNRTGQPRLIAIIDLDRQALR